MQTTTPSSAESRWPNIVYILADEHRHDALGCAGNTAITTPNLDELARQGVRFANTWCQGPVCQPSRASIITGRYPHDIGVVRNFERDFDAGWPTFMSRLQQVGYTTANVGKTHYFPSIESTEERPPIRSDAFARRVKSFGFDHVLEEFDRHVHANSSLDTPYKQFLRESGYLDLYLWSLSTVMPFTQHHWDGRISPLPDGLEMSTYLTNCALAWLDEHTGASPFFLQLSYVQPHSPLMGDPKWAAYYQDADVPIGPRIPAKSAVPSWSAHLSNLRARSHPELHDDEYLRRGIRQYYAMISLLDECIGRLVRYLRERDLLDNTWIIYSSDHGQMLGDHGLMAKSNFYRGSVQVPAIVRPPNTSSTAPGRVHQGIVQSVDLTATILDIAGAGPLPAARGRSLVEQITTPTDPAEASIGFSEIGSRESSDILFWALTDGHRRITTEAGSRTVCEVFDLDEDPDELNDLTGTRDGDVIVQELTHRFPA